MAEDKEKKDSTSESENKDDAEETKEESEESDVEKEKEKEKEKEDSQNNIDYEAELKREREAGEKERDGRIKAEKALAEQRFKGKKKKEDEDEEEEEGERPLTRSELDAVLTRHGDAVRKEVLTDTIRGIASRLAGSDSEMELIIEIHKNRTFPSHLSLDEQMEEAYAIANRKPLLAQNAELRRSLRSKDTKSDDAAGTHLETPETQEPKAMSNQDIQAIRAAGFQWNGKHRLYEKQLGGAKVLNFDPKTKKRWVTNK